MSSFQPTALHGLAERIARKGVELGIFVSGVNTALDTGIIDTTGVQQVLIHAVITAGAGPVPFILYGVNDAGGNFYLGTASPGSGGNGTVYSLGGFGAPSGNYLLSVLPRRIRITAAGVASTNITFTLHGR
jgi:hypothetical protein